ncbi:glycosyltransferase, partial [Piscirickettsia litoralis]|uniref:glycosyltransferase n=1 Tax=Piscirickettsia litoralis TaxID=1891921 RepID=UPI001F28187B
LFYKLIVPTLAKRVKRIVTISNYTKQKIIETLGVDEKKINVIYNGVSDIYRKKSQSEIENVRQRYDIKEAYFFV